jgi:imidazolonepropionase
MTRLLLTNARIATMVPDTGPYGLVENASLLIDGPLIARCGADPLEADMPQLDLGGRLVTPGLIDCHTHVVFGGNRAREFELRQSGASYEQIARAGGGIVSTVAQTRAASEDELLRTALRRVDALIAEGVTTIEIKSGYGLTIADELKMLRVARRIGEARPIRVLATYLAAHAMPPEFAGNPDAYLDQVVLPGLDAAHREGLVDAVDGFCEGIAFSPAQIERVFTHAKALGLPLKLHAEQLSNLGGAALAARHGALSADHLEYLDAPGVAALAGSGSVAVLLPGAFYTLREKQLPPVDLLREARVAIAVATDCNPGSSPLTSLLLAMNMAATLFGLTPEEALAGTTRHAARALGLRDCGSIRPGYRADLAVWDVEHPAELTYRIGFNPLHQRFQAGVPTP